MNNHGTRLHRLSVTLVLVAATTFGVAALAEPPGNRGGPPDRPGGYGAHGGPGAYRGPPRHIDIPAGHLPPPGQCRVWYPGEPPGQQPPPGDCYDLRRGMPGHAWLLRRPRGNPEHVEIISRRPTSGPAGEPYYEEEPHPGDGPPERSDVEIIVDIYEAITGERVERLLER